MYDVMITHIIARRHVVFAHEYLQSQPDIGKLEAKACSISMFDIDASVAFIVRFSAILAMTREFSRCSPYTRRFIVFRLVDDDLNSRCLVRNVSDDLGLPPDLFFVVTADFGKMSLAARCVALFGASCHESPETDFRQCSLV